MMHWNMLKKAIKFEFSSFNMFKCVIGSPVWRFCTTRLLSCKWPIKSQEGVGFVYKGKKKWQIFFQGSLKKIAKNWK